MNRLDSWKRAVWDSPLGQSSTVVLLLAIGSYPNSFEDEFSPTEKSLAYKTRLSERTVRTHLKPAEKGGWINVRQEKLPGIKLRNHYRLSFPEAYATTHSTVSCKSKPYSKSRDDSTQPTGKDQQPVAAAAVAAAMIADKDVDVDVYESTYVYNGEALATDTSSTIHTDVATQGPNQKVVLGIEDENDFDGEDDSVECYDGDGVLIDRHPTTSSVASKSTVISAGNQGADSHNPSAWPLFSP